MQDLVDSVIHPIIFWNVVFSSPHSIYLLSNHWFSGIFIYRDSQGLLRSGHLIRFLFSGAPLLSAGAGQHAPSSPDSGLRVQQHH